MLEEYPELVKCIEGGMINSVKNSIEIGNRLIHIKATVKDRKDSWLDFMNDNFSLSIRTCQEYMKLARTPIHENHYKLGTAQIHDMLRSNTDLSHSVIDRFCQGCIGYGEGDKCMSIFDNQEGACPCTNCDNKSNCIEMCDDLYAFEDSR